MGCGSTKSTEEKKEVKKEEPVTESNKTPNGDEEKKSKLESEEVFQLSYLKEKKVNEFSQPKEINEYANKPHEEERDPFEQEPYENIPNDPNKVIEDLGYDLMNPEDNFRPMQVIESIKYDGEMNKGSSPQPLMIPWNNAS